MINYTRFELYEIRDNIVDGCTHHKAGDKHMTVRWPLFLGSFQDLDTNK